MRGLPDSIMDSVGESSFNSTNSFEDSNNSMIYDENGVHQGQKTFSCKSCDKSYTQPHSLVVERVPEFSGTRPESDLFWATRTRLYQVGYVPDPTRTRPFEPKH